MAAGRRDLSGKCPADSPVSNRGTLNSQGLAVAEGGRVALTTSRHVRSSPVTGLVDRIDLRFKPGVTNRDLEAIRQILPEGVVLSSPWLSKKADRR